MPAITGAQIRAGRALLKWTAAELAAASGVSVPTIRRAETLDGEVTMNAPNVAAIRRAFEEAGVEFTEGEGVRIAKGPAS